MLNSAKKVNRAFTIIEVLIVLVVLAVLTIIILSSIDAVQQIARSRDTGRISNILQLGRGLSAYYVARNGNYPSQDASWVTTLKASKEIATVPANPSYALIGGGFPGCGAGHANEDNWCYALSGSFAVAYVPLNAKANNSKCAGQGEQSYIVYATRAGRAGIMCSIPSPSEDGGSFIE